MDSAEEDFEDSRLVRMRSFAGTNTTSPENPDFGYVEPPRRPRQPDSDAQTTLF